MHSRKEVESILLSKLKSAYSFDSSAVSQQIKYYKSLLKSIKKEEPFQGIPDNLKIHMERLTEQVQENLYDARPLANELRELAVTRKEEVKSSKRVSWLGVLVGIIGCLIGALGFLGLKPSDLVDSTTTIEIIRKPAVGGGNAGSVGGGNAGH